MYSNYYVNVYVEGGCKSSIPIYTNSMESAIAMVTENYNQDLIIRNGDGLVIAFFNAHKWSGWAFE